MDKAKWDRIHDLCSRIAVEQDQQKFLVLVKELNRMLSADDLGLRDDAPERKKV
jgi:hypothetical protein